MTADNPSKNARLAMVANAFAPHAPVDDRSLFADRPNQVDVCIEALFQRGLHIALYGERGVGKTSLAVVLPEIIRGANVPTLGAVRVRVNRAGRADHRADARGSSRGRSSCRGARLAADRTRATPITTGHRGGSSRLSARPAADRTR